MSIEKIENNNELYAIIVRKNHQVPGITFFTPDDFPQQLAFMKHPAGKKITPHVHNIVPREIQLTSEILFIKKGKIQINFFDNEEGFFQRKILEGGDVILLYKGGHGFDILEDIEMFEVKQGPYLGELDKKRFSSITEEAQDNG